jgi:hypothetical protein
MRTNHYESTRLDGRFNYLLPPGHQEFGRDFVISLETLDDVTFETKGGKPEELLQTKHHRSREATLADSGEDLWKSLRVWFEGHKTKAIRCRTRRLEIRLRRMRLQD